MNKSIKLVLLFIMFFPIIVKAAECDASKVYVDSITVDQNSNVEEIEEASTNNKTINLHMRMNNVGNNIKYKIVVKNDSNDDYEIDKNKININSDYIDYSLESDNNIIKAKTSKSMYLNVLYKTKVPEDNYQNGIYVDNINMKLNLSSGNTFINPKTGISYSIIIVLLIISTLLLSIKNKTKKVITVLIITLLIPISIKALCKANLNINSKVELDILDSSFCMYDLSDSNGYFDNFHKIKIPIKKNMTWSEFYDYAKSGKDNRFVFKVGYICDSTSRFNCYREGEEGFNQHINDSNYYKDYSLSYNNYIISWYSKTYNQDPNDYMWEGIDSYFINDNFDTFNSFYIINNLNEKIKEYDSGTCYCPGCG